MCSMKRLVQARFSIWAPAQAVTSAYCAEGLDVVAMVGWDLLQTCNPLVLANKRE